MSQAHVLPTCDTWCRLAFVAMVFQSAVGTSPYEALILQRSKPPVLEWQHFRHLDDADFGGRPAEVTDSLAAIGVPAFDKAVVSLRCSVAGLMQLMIDDMDLHSANFNAASGSYSYELLADEDVDPAEVRVMVGGCNAMKRAYLAMSGIAIEHGVACATLLDSPPDREDKQLCILGARADRIRMNLAYDVDEVFRFEKETRQGGTRPSPVTNASAEILERHWEAMDRILKLWAGSESSAADAAGFAVLVGSVAERLKLFADNTVQATILNLLPRLNPHHEGFQAVVRAIEDVGWPRIVHSGIYGGRWKVLAQLLQMLSADCSGGIGLRVAEVGVEKGQTLLYLNSRRSLPIAEYVGVDPYTIAGKPSLDEVLEGYHRNLSSVIAARHADVVSLLRTDSESAAPLFEDGHFDLVFIDADHEFLPTKRDIEMWRRKVKPGGILAGHDFSMHHLAVVLAVMWASNTMSYHTIHLGGDTTWWCYV